MLNHSRQRRLNPDSTLCTSFPDLSLAVEVEREVEVKRTHRKREKVSGDVVSDSHRHALSDLCEHPLAGQFEAFP